MKFPFIFITLFFISVSIIFGLLNYFQIQTQFYLWEILFDSKVFALIGLMYFFQKNIHLDSRQIFRDYFLWNTSKNILFFCLVLAPLAITIFLGYILKFIEFNSLNNPETLFLGTVFDIPAIFIFSLTSVFFEEIFFRVFLQKLFLTKNIELQTVLSAVFWMMYSITEVINSELDIYVLIVALVYFFSFGVFLSLLARHFGSIWLGYSFRIGVISLVPIILTSVVVESDSFFISKNLLFSFEGIVTVLLLLGFSLLLFFKGKTKKSIQTMEV